MTTQSMQAIDRKIIVDAYRNLYKSSLRAVAFAIPARHVIKARLRKAFRDGNPTDYDQTKVANTVEFLNQASKATGVEHRILKNLLHVHYFERENTLKTRLHESPGKIAWHSPEAKDGYRSFYNALKVFNDNHQLCLI